MIVNPFMLCNKSHEWGLCNARCRYGTSDSSRCKLAAAPRREAEADSRCVLVSAAGTRVQTCLPPHKLNLHLQVVCLCNARCRHGTSD